MIGTGRAQTKGHTVSKFISARDGSGPKEKKDNSKKKKKCGVWNRSGKRGGINWGAKVVVLPLGGSGGSGTRTKKESRQEAWNRGENVEK